MGHTANRENAVEGMAELWQKICTLQGVTLHTSGRSSRQGKAFTFQVRGSELIVSTKAKSVTWSSVQEALLKVRAIASEQGLDVPIIKGPKQLGVFGASYLYPVFLFLGVIRSYR